MFARGFWQAADAHPETVALREHNGRAISFAALRDEVHACAHVFRSRGLAQGGVVAVMLSNRIEFVVTYLACIESAQVNRFVHLIEKPFQMRMRSFADIETAHCNIAQFKQPHPEPILAAMKILKTPASSTAYVGDSPHDLVAARAAGVHAVAALWGPAPREELERERPDWVAESPVDLLKIFN